jgi:hypothetical protein
MYTKQMIEDAATSAAHALAWLTEIVQACDGHPSDRQTDLDSHIGYLSHEMHEVLMAIKTSETGHGYPF